MKRLGLKQAQLADRAHISAPYLSQILAAKKAPRPHTIADLAAALNVRAEWLASGKGDARAPDGDRRPAPESPADPEWDQAIEYLKTIYRAPNRKWWLGIMANLEALAKTSAERPPQKRAARAG